VLDFVGGVKISIATCDAAGKELIAGVAGKKNEIKKIDNFDAKASRLYLHLWHLAAMIRFER
jgi:hypothetical protein